MKFLFTFFLCFLLHSGWAQHSVSFEVRSSGGEVLAGATVKWIEGNKTRITDSSGIVLFESVGEGKQNFRISFIGYQTQTLAIQIPSDLPLPFQIALTEMEAEEEEQVTIMTTRTRGMIANIPTRVEVISGEELEEKGNMRPGEIRMLLNESTGIQAQQTSATSYNSSIRIQGLDGRYTQLLQDGYPLYGGFSGGLSIMQIAPLNLKQVEVIKGSSSTLYGGGAIAGIVNLITRTPGERRLDFLANATSAGGLDLSGFYGEDFGKLGLTVYGSRNSSSAYDPADIGLTAIPKFERYTINPRMFLHLEKTTADLGISYITEDRIGGSMDYIRNGGKGYFEKNNTGRLTTQFGIEQQLNEVSYLQAKNSYSRFQRQIRIPDYEFEAVQQSSFTELTWNYSREKFKWIAGFNLFTDDLSEKKRSSPVFRDYHYDTYGVFVQNTWDAGSRWTFETGLRSDYVQEYGAEILPRLSALFRISNKFTTRLGGGFGYKTPTFFTEESERIHYRDLSPVDVLNTRNERSLGGNWDINFRTQPGEETHLNINQLFYYTRLNHPLILTNAGTGLELRNADGFIETKGIETNIRFQWKEFKLFVGYTFTDAKRYSGGSKFTLPLTARHRLNHVLMYEIEEKLKIGFEAYYFSPQVLTDGSNGKQYWITGLMAEKLWEKISLFINFENFTNTRQSRFDTIYTGTLEQPVFKDIYAPVEGFLVNGGIRLRL